LKHLSFEHSNLFSQCEIVAKVKDLLQQIQKTEEEDEEEWEVTTFAADVKEMYTCLPQSFLLHAIWFILMDAKRHNRRSEITVYLREPKRSRMGKLYNQEMQACTLTMEEVFQIIKFEVTHCHFLLSQRIFIQKVGIGMGQTGSPPQSMALCM
jgi:hypothetical protein